MTPEYGCTCTLFPVDDRTLDYLRLTAAAPSRWLWLKHAKAQGYWNDPEAGAAHLCRGDRARSFHGSTFSGGPRAPHDRIPARQGRRALPRHLRRARPRRCDGHVEVNGEDYELTHGAIAIAAVTSCTTATDQAMMLATGLMARNAAERGLAPAPLGEDHLAPGSRATELLLERAGLTEPLRQLGFYTCGFGSHELHWQRSGPSVRGHACRGRRHRAASVLSGNRNFEGRISPDVSQNYLMEAGQRHRLRHRRHHGHRSGEGSPWHGR